VASGGESTEQSVHNAYVELIASSQHYVYIENQFFISSIPSVTNKVGDALFYRVCRAISSSEIFRVFIILPIHPGKQGVPEETDKQESARVSEKEE
jgi:phospholipase D1/2